MIKIANYSLVGNMCVLKLKCSCGLSRIFEIEEEGQKYYFCGKCRARKTLQELKNESSTYWQSRKWKVDCDPDERTHPRIHVNYNVELTIKATRYSPPRYVMHGQMVVLSESGGLIVVQDFKESYFPDLSTECRSAAIKFSEPDEERLPSLTGRVVGVRYTPRGLPQCRIAVAFEGLNEQRIEALRKHIEEHVAEISS